MPYCNTDCFEAYLEALSRQRPDEFKVVILDNGAFHKAQRLIIPPNIALHFLPPYSPELNPAEQIWRYIKDRLANQGFESLETLGAAADKIINAFTPEIIQSITGRPLYTQCGV